MADRTPATWSYRLPHRAGDYARPRDCRCVQARLASTGADRRAAARVDSHALDRAADAHRRVLGCAAVAAWRVAVDPVRNQRRGRAAAVHVLRRLSAPD